MIMWRKGKGGGGGGIPLQIGYLGRLPVFHVFWNSNSYEESEKYRLDVALCYTKGRTLFPSEDLARKAAAGILAQWLTATGLKEDDE